MEFTSVPLSFILLISIGYKNLRLWLFSTMLIRALRYAF